MIAPGSLPGTGDTSDQALAVLVADAVSPGAGVTLCAAAIAQRGFVAGVVPDVPASPPVEVTAGIGALASVQGDTLTRS